MKTILFEFNMKEEFTPLLKSDRLTFTLIANGKTTLKINDKIYGIESPCILVYSCHDKILLLDGNQLVMKSFSFHPAFVNKSLSLENLTNNDFSEIADEHDCSLLRPFIMRNESYNGIIKALPQINLRIFEWFDLAYKENEIRGSRYWQHRVRRYLMQILFSLEDVYINQNDSDALSDESIIDIVLEYIHANYSNEISLDSLCKLVYINRTTLTRKFKAHTRRSPINYLLHYRLNIACELLTHSKLSISSIAEATGFKYETYFIKQFSAKIGMTPTQYRQSDGFETLNINESRIVDEF
ncbi:MAG: AraC family transcriptional regulator [Oscillospiraceae bacterium]|nr:AraC family transcriptional regulator [Oscillospiraceae bacterium]